MKFKTHFFTFLLIAGLAAPIAVSGQEKAATQETTQQQQMEIMMKYGTPAKEHEYLKKYVGTWDVETKSWEKPGAEPMVGKGSMKGEILFEGRYLRTSFESTMMNMPFKGLQIMGYDLYQKKYVAIWIDNMSTAFAPTTGTLDPTGKVFTETGLWPDPMTGGTSKVKIVTTWLADGKYKFEMFMPGPAGKDIKWMEITYTKRSSM
ncbi:MAG: hypothetical protein A2W03_17205 [Candidatus Aminicenantes bacterium RBG_16_63_16]|nr:MAG: hypothetical protein A2W03_17205 [Candidatus Aminicenantes bacterium RBG_16_63_16]